VAANECTSFAGHFDGHGGATVQYRGHCLKKEILGFQKKPLNAAIRRLLSPYCPGDHQGDNQQNNRVGLNIPQSLFLAIFAVVSDRRTEAC
jgi:hypothetical protein